MGLLQDSWQTLDKRLKPAVVVLPLFLWCGSALLNVSMQLWLITGLLLISLILFYLVQDHQHKQRILHAENEYHQIEALLGIYKRFDGKFAMTGLRRYAASPDMLFHVLELIGTHRPHVITELGSGSSTKLISAYIEKIDLDCQFLSIEHDRKYLDESAARLVSGKVEFCYCPLIQYHLNGKSYSWYDLSSFQPDAPIDLLIVDGPPVYLNQLARYPALPLMLDKLSDGAIILLDDAARPDEQEIIRQWMALTPCIRMDLQAEKGLTLLFRIKA